MDTRIGRWQRVFSLPNLFLFCGEVWRTSFFIMALNRTNYNLLNEEKLMMFYGHETNILEENIVHCE
jgi:hypothetical protein